MSGRPPYAFENHSLADHMFGCLALIEDFMRINRNYLNAAYTRLNRAGLDVPKLETIEDMLRIGAVIHDLGKAYKYYQERLEKYGGGFEYHEILSTISCYKILRNNYLSENLGLEVLLLMSILNHHQAFRESISEILFDDSSSINKVIRIAKMGLCEGVSHLEPVLNKLGLTVNEVFAKDIEIASMLNEVRGILNSFLRRRFDENRRWIKLYNLVMFPIILVDNLDACEKRGGRQNRLVIAELRKVMIDE